MRAARAPRSQVLVGGKAPLPSRVRVEFRRLKGYAAHRQRYDARRRLNTDSPMDTLFKRILAHDVCAFCKAFGFTMDRDHIQPLLAGGSDSWPNLTAACSACNRGRRELDVLSFLSRRLEAA